MKLEPPEVTERKLRRKLSRNGSKWPQLEEADQGIASAGRECASPGGRGGRGAENRLELESRGGGGEKESK